MQELWLSVRNREEKIQGDPFSFSFEYTLTSRRAFSRVFIANGWLDEWMDGLVLLFEVVVAMRPRIWTCTI